MAAHVSSSDQGSDSRKICLRKKQGCYGAEAEVTETIGYPK